MHPLTLKLTAASVLIVAMQAAHAAPDTDNTGWYLGANLGWASATADGTPSRILGEKKNTYAGKIYYGYRFNPHLALESGYFRSGVYKKSSSIRGAEVWQSVRPSAFYGAVVGTLPIGDSFALNGRVGLGLGRASGSNPFAATDDVSGSKTGLYAGFGAEYRLSKAFAITVDYDRFRVSPRLSTGMVSVGAKLSM